jgi:hypothetical protein
MRIMTLSGVGRAGQNLAVWAQTGGMFQAVPPSPMSEMDGEGTKKEGEPPAPADAVDFGQGRPASLDDCSISTRTSGELMG